MEAGAKSRNVRLAAIIAQAGMTHAQVARAIVLAAKEAGVAECAGIGRSHVSHWVAGSNPSSRTRILLREVLSRSLGRPITFEDMGLAEMADACDVLDWHADTLAALTDIGRLALDAERRRFLGAAAYSLAALTLPDARWWDHAAALARAAKSTAGRAVGRGDVDAVRDMIAMFSAVDQRRGGGHARSAVIQYLTSDVVGHLGGRFPDDHTRRAMFSAAGELAYLAGWMAFDNAEHVIAQHFYRIAVKLAAEADDPPMAAHVLRAMAHQAVDLGYPRHALQLATASMNGNRYTSASPRERALLGVVHARALALAGQNRQAATALIKAENDLRTAQPGDDEPSRVLFFGEASLAHETACTLRDMGDLAGAASAFRHSVRTRKAAVFTRTHAVTLGYLGVVQARQGNVEQACGTWAVALDAMDGVRSGRTRQVAVDIRSILSPFRHRGIRAVGEVDRQATSYLARTQ